LAWLDVGRLFHGAAPELIDPQRFGFVGTKITRAGDTYALRVIALGAGRVHVNPYGGNIERDGVILGFSLGESRSPI